MIDPADGDNTAHELQNISKLKLPPLWPSNPDIWFRQVEAQFTLTRTSSETTNFNILLAHLSTEIISTVVDLIQNPPDINPYSSLKKLLIERLSLSEEKQLDDVLLGSQMGYQKPSDFYRAMLTTVGGSQVVSPNLLLKLWPRRLPRVVSVALLASGKEDVVNILSIADKVWESMNLTSTSLLKRAIDILETMSANIKSGFSATGIVPLDRHQVLKRLPKQRILQEDENDPNHWAGAVIDLLSDSRNACKPTYTNQKENGGC
nr:uncharacterized protein LOC111419278 [Onthophagus taurus]